MNLNLFIFVLLTFIIIGHSSRVSAKYVADIDEIGKRFKFIFSESAPESMTEFKIVYSVCIASACDRNCKAHRFLYGRCTSTTTCTCYRWICIIPKNIPLFVWNQNKTNCDEERKLKEKRILIFFLSPYWLTANEQQNNKILRVLTSF